MKFRAPTFQVSRDPDEDGFRPTPFKMPTMPVLREKKSRPTLDGSTEQVNERPPSRPGTGYSSLKKRLSKPNLRSNAENGGEDVPPVPAIPFMKRKKSMPNFSNGADDDKDAGQSPAMKQALKDLLQKTGTNLRETGAKLESRMPQKKPKAPEPTHKRSSRSFDIGDDVLERAVKASKDEKRTPKSFEMNRKSKHTSQKPSLSVAAPLEPQDQSKKLLSVDQVRAMCIGAPCFSVEEWNGRYKPQVLFRGSHAETSAEFPRDFKAFGHPSFAACTLGFDASREQAQANFLDSEDSDATRATADLMEVPSMLSADGLDPGAVGFEHFLQLPIADDVVRVDDSDPSVKRRMLKSSPGELGLRPPNIEVLIFRLTELSQLHAACKDPEHDPLEQWNETKTEEMGVDLFGKLLSADMGTTVAGTGSVSMRTQIRALQKVLRTSGLWYDFALVDWRTRIGQVLWENASAGPTATVDEDEVDERDVLFLQVTLAAELLVRVNAVKSRAESVAPIISEREMDILDSLRTSKVNWDLLLAERFLENVNVSTKGSTEIYKKHNRMSIFDAILFRGPIEETSDAPQYLQPHLTPKHGERQLAGLLHFAETLNWPHAQNLPRSLDITLDLNEKYSRLSAVPSTYLTPMSSPMLQQSSISRSSSFGFDIQPEKPALSKTTTAQSVQLSPVNNSRIYSGGFDACGWLSRSWLSGLVMPGEAASHFLMSTLLEHSPKATTLLGEKANLYGGFIYSGRSYWSKSCVVGRVLAAKKGAAECMEWISLPELGEAQEDGWRDLAVKEMPDSKTRPRILNAETVAKDSDLLHNKGLMHTARVGDFTWPTDGPIIMGNEVLCQGLSFNNSTKVPDVDGDVMAGKRSIATITFGSVIKRKLTVVEIPLLYDACFVSSYPCHPRTVKSPSKLPLPNPFGVDAPGGRSPRLPSDQKENRDPEKEVVRPKTAPAPVDSAYGSKSTSASTINFSASSPEPMSTPIHPLHIDYHYDIVPVSTLFTSATETRPRAASSGAERQPEMQAAAKEVMVLDCRGAEDLELFARAWCAKVGENAVIGKSGRTCLACCIREARALGICVVIRT